MAAIHAKSEGDSDACMSRQRDFFLPDPKPGLLEEQAVFEERPDPVRIRACPQLSDSQEHTRMIHGMSADSELTDAPLRPSGRPMGQDRG